MTNKEFVAMFLKTFASNISETDKKNFNLYSKKKGLLWDIFAANLVPCYCGDDARKEYDRIDNTEAIEINYSGNNSLIKDDAETSILSNNHMTSSDIDDCGLFEFYVVGKNFEWCYVVTHELDLCGPYFCFKRNSKK